MRPCLATLALVGLLTASLPCQAQTIPVQVFFEDFDGVATVGDLPSQFSTFGAGTVQLAPVNANLAGLGAGYSGNYLEMYGASAGIGFGQEATHHAGLRLTLTDLPEHSSIDLNFLHLIAGDNQEGDEQFTINIGDAPNATPYTATPYARFRNQSGGPIGYPNNFLNPAVPFEAGVVLSEGALEFRGGGQLDAAANLGLQTSVFDNIPHTGDTLVIEILGNSNNSGEIFGLDNFEVILNTPPLAPEPSTLVLGAVLIAVLGGATHWKSRRA